MKILAQTYLIGLFAACVFLLGYLMIKAHVVLLGLMIIGSITALSLFLISVMWAIGESI